MSKPDPFGANPTAEKFYSVSQVAAMFPGRGRRWVIDRVKAGQFGTVLKDDGGWLIPLSGLRAFVSARAVDPADLAPELQPSPNLVQLRKT